MFDSQETTRLVIQVAGKQITETAVTQAEHNRMAIDGVRRRVTLESIARKFKRFVANPWSFRRFSQKFQAGFAIYCCGKWAQYINPEVTLGKKIKGFGIAKFEAPENQLFARVVFGKCVFPFLERLVQ